MEDPILRWETFDAASFGRLTSRSITRVETFALPQPMPGPSVGMEDPILRWETFDAASFGRLAACGAVASVAA